MHERGHLSLQTIIVCACALTGSVGVAAPWIDMGLKDEFAFDQPVVRIGVYQQLPNDTKGTWLGPSTADEFFFSLNEFILDTGASSIIAMNEAEADLRSRGYFTENTVLEQGVSGYEELDVSASYYLEVSYTNSAVNALPSHRIMSGQFDALFGINGIVGMPAMVGKVITLDTSVWADIEDIFDIVPMGVHMNNALPASNGHRYSVPLTAAAFPLDGDDPLPNASPIPMLQMGVGSDHLNTSGSFILDTGAAMSFISTEMAMAIGLDSSGNGQLDAADARWADTLPIGGIGGTIDAPLFLIDRFTVPTEQGVDLVWNLDSALTVAIIDIHPDIDGVLGSDLLTSGWFTFTEEEIELEPGPVQQVHFDFRQFFEDGDAGKLYFDLTPSVDVVLPDLTAGDLNGDQVVDTVDYLLWRVRNGTSQQYQDWQSHYGTNYGSSGAASVAAAGVPEPAAAVLLMIGALVSATRRRRRFTAPARSAASLRCAASFSP